MNASPLAGQIRNLLTASILLLAASSALATEYEYRDLLGNTLAPQKCSTKADAEARARESYNIDKYVKVFCETLRQIPVPPGRLACDLQAHQARLGRHASG